jgi:hypothetical protein
MPRSGNPLFPVVNLMLVPFGLFGAIVGVLVLASGDGGDLWWLYVGFAASGTMMLGGAAANLLRWRRWQRREAAAAGDMAAAARAHAADPSAALASPVIAHWTYEPDEWKAYASREVSHRGREALWLFVGTVVLGMLLLGWRENVDWREVLAASVAVGAMLGAGKWLIARSEHDGNVATPRGEVVITPTAVLMNGRYQVIQDHHFRFRGATSLEHERPQILELSIEWPTRSGPAGETYRIPVPAGREEEARTIAHELNTGYSAHSS